MYIYLVGRVLKVMLRYYIVTNSGQRMGPFTIDELRELACGGAIKPTETVLSEDGRENTPLFKVLPQTTGFSPWDQYPH